MSRKEVSKCINCNRMKVIWKGIGQDVYCKECYEVKA